MTNDDVSAIIDLINEVDDFDSISRVIAAATVRSLQIPRPFDPSQTAPGPTTLTPRTPLFEVKVTGRTLRPKYLFGAVLPVHKVNDKTYGVRIPNEPRYGRFAGVETRVPKSCVTTIDNN